MDRATKIFEKIHGNMCFDMKNNVIRWIYNEKYNYQVVFFCSLVETIALGRITNEIHNYFYISHYICNSTARSTMSSVSLDKKLFEEFDQVVLNCHNQYLKKQTLIDFI